jgi:hypothetical protein
VQQDDLEFQIVSDSIWPLPARAEKGAPGAELPTGASPVRFQLRVTNHQKEQVRFLSAVGTPLLQSADGKELEVHCFGNDHIRVSKYVSIAPDKTVTVDGTASVYTGGRYGTCLWWEDAFGTNWWIDGLKPGKYVLRLRYNTRRDAEANSTVGKSGAWLGDVRTSEVPIEIVDLQASDPAVCHGVEALSRADGTWEFKKAEELGFKDTVVVRALADGTWQAPAAGKQTQVCLGFRMRTANKWWVRILPGIARVSIESADGVELPAKKAAAKVSMEPPQLLALRPEYSHTVASPASLFRDGKTMTLAWADDTGQVWHVENLKPGRYAVSYTIRAEKGEPSPYISYWVGELRTQTVTVEITE